MANNRATIVFTIETYKPEIQWDRWVKRLEGAFKLFNVEPIMASTYLLHYMGPESYDILCDKLAPDQPEGKTYIELVHAMAQHYSPEPLEMVENYRFQKRYQQDGETIQEYAAALQKMAIHCKFGDYLMTALRNQLVFGIRSQKIQSRLLEAKDLTFKVALETAIAMELTHFDNTSLTL